MMEYVKWKISEVSQKNVDDFGKTTWLSTSVLNKLAQAMISVNKLWEIPILRYWLEAFGLNTDLVVVLY